jgi:hypothetical protein
MITMPPFATRQLAAKPFRCLRSRRRARGATIPDGFVRDAARGESRKHRACMIRVGIGRPIAAL